MATASLSVANVATVKFCSPASVASFSASTRSAPAVQAPRATLPSSLTVFSGARPQHLVMGSDSAPFKARQSRMDVHVQAGRREVTSCAAKKVAVLGAAGGIGQPLSLLLKMSPHIGELHCYDIANVNGVVADLSHCNTPCQVKAYQGADNLAACLQGMDLIVIPAGVPRKPGMTRDDLFNINAGIVKTLIEAIAKNAPKALIAIISNPVNSTVPIAAEVLKKAGVYDPKRLFGVTTLDIVRANTFVAEKKGLNVKDVDVPVVGGHAGVTILPLLSQTKPAVTFTQDELVALTGRIQEAGTEVVEAKGGAGSATLSMAYAAARFTESLLRGLNGETNVHECTFVQSPLYPDQPFFASKVRLGPNGVEEILPLGTLSAFETEGLQKAKDMLKGNVDKGIEFGKGQ